MNEVVEIRAIIKQTCDQWRQGIVSRALCRLPPNPHEIPMRASKVELRSKRVATLKTPPTKTSSPHRSVLLSPDFQPRVRTWLFRKGNDILQDAELVPEGMYIESFIHSTIYSAPTLKGTVLSSVQFSSVAQSLSCVWLFATPLIAEHQASLSNTNSRSSLRLTSIKLVMPSSHLILCRPLLRLPSTPPSIRVFSNESTLRKRWPKYWSFSFSIIPSPRTDLL